jgi:hypothetical protein
MKTTRRDGPTQTVTEISCGLLWSLVCVLDLDLLAAVLAFVSVITIARIGRAAHGIPAATF